jgi:hypothetical protein
VNGKEHLAQSAAGRHREAVEKTKTKTDFKQLI